MWAEGIKPAAAAWSVSPATGENLKAAIAAFFVYIPLNKSMEIEAS